MNLVRLQYGGGGELRGAIIYVTTETSLIGKKAYLYKNGDTTPISNATISSSGSCSFTVLEVGTYTVKASDGTYETEGSVSINSEQIINKDIVSIELSFVVTITFDVYSAPNDSIYYYEDDNISNPEITLCTTNADGKGTGSLIVNKYKAKNITFYSTVAKDTTDGASAYNKSISIDGLTSEIYVMPKGAIYWYGYNNIKASGKAIVNGGSYGTSGFIYTVSTHSITVGINSNDYSSYGHVTDAPVDITEYTNLKANILSVFIGENKDWAGMFISTNQYKNNTDAVSTKINTIGIKTLDISNATNKNVYVGIGANNNIAARSEIQFNALWLE